MITVLESIIVKRAFRTSTTLLNLFLQYSSLSTCIIIEFLGKKCERNNNYLDFVFPSFLTNKLTTNMIIQFYDQKTSEKDPSTLILFLFFLGYILIIQLSLAAPNESCSNHDSGNLPLHRPSKI